MQDLAANQEITAYVRMRAPEMALAPADPQERYVFIPIEEPQEQLAALPQTARFLPLQVLLGGMSFVAGWMAHRDPPPTSLIRRLVLARARHDVALYFKGLGMSLESAAGIQTRRRPAE